MRSLRTDDVIAQPGQNLTPFELTVLAALANGNSPAQIAEATGATPATIRAAELDARDKLGASTHPHMIARGFILGVLLPRALCMFVAFASAIDYSPAQRVRIPRPTRPATSLARTTRAASGRSAADQLGSIFALRTAAA